MTLTGLIVSIVGVVAAIVIGIWQIMIMRLTPHKNDNGEDGNGLSKDPRRWANKGKSATVRVDLLPPNGVIGREDLLGKLQRYLRHGGLVVLVGPGGMGKSTAARELARKMPHGPPRWEVSGLTKEEFTASLINVARDLNASEAQIENIGAAKPSGPECLWELLNKGRKGWLLIIDNADDPELLAAPRAPGTRQALVAEGTGWARTSGRGLMLITSREYGDEGQQGVWPARATVIEVTELSDDDGAKILLEEAPRAGNEAQARDLAHRLGGLPLALRLAGRYLKSKGAVHTSFDGFRKALESDPRVIRYLDRHAKDPKAIERIMVMFTWELSLDALTNRGLPQARPLLRLLSCFAPSRPIPLRLLRTDLLKPLLQPFVEENGDSDVADVPVGELIGGLASLGLVHADSRSREKALLVHPVIADTNRTHLIEPEAFDPSPALVCGAAVDLLGAGLDDLVDDRPADWQVFRELSPHLQAILGIATPADDEGEVRRLDQKHLDTLVQIAGHAAMAHGQMGLPDFGVDLAASALELARQAGENVTPTILLARQRKGFLLGQADREAEAERIYQEVLDAQLRIWPKDDPANLIARHNLAASVAAQGRWPEAETALKEVLDDERQLLGDDHRHTLATRQALAMLLYQQGFWKKAERELRSLLRDQQRVVGANSRGSLITRFNLAQTVRHQEGRRGAAEADSRVLLQDALQVLDEEHPITVAIREFREDVLLHTSSFSTPELREQMVEDLFKKAVGLGQKRSHEAAAHAFQQVVDRFGGDPAPTIRELVAKALLNKGISLGSLERGEEEATAYQELVDRFGGDPAPTIRELVARALRYKAIVLASQGRPEDALPVAEEAAELYQGLAKVDPKAQQADLDSARQLLAQIKTDAVTRLFNSAVGLGRAGSLEDEVTAYQQLINRFGNDTDPTIRELVTKAQHNKSSALAEMGRPPENGPPGRGSGD